MHSWMVPNEENSTTFSFPSLPDPLRVCKQTHEGCPGRDNPRAPFLRRWAGSLCRQGLQQAGAWADDRGLPLAQGAGRPLPPGSPQAGAG